MKRKEEKALGVCDYGGLDSHKVPHTNKSPLCVNWRPVESHEPHRFPLGVCELSAEPHVEFACDWCKNWRPVEANAPAAPPDISGEFCSIHGWAVDWDEVHKERFCKKCRAGEPPLNPPSQTSPSDAAIEEAERVVDRMTCKWCCDLNQFPLDGMLHKIPPHGYVSCETSKPCTKEGRAILGAILPILRRVR